MGLFDFGKKTKKRVVKGIASFEHHQERSRKRETKRLGSVAEVEEARARVRKAKLEGRKNHEPFGLREKVRKGKSGRMRLI